MSTFPSIPDLFSCQDGRDVSLRPLYELENGSLAGIEPDFVDTFLKIGDRLDTIMEVLSKGYGLTGPEAFICAPMGEKELGDPGFPGALAQYCQQMGAAPSNLCLFFADDLCLKHGHRALDQFLYFKRHGFRLGLDITNLQTMPGLFVERLPADVLRLDPLDTSIRQEDPDSIQDIQAFTRYAANLLMVPAARGVRSLGQLNMLKDVGIRIGQGPLFSTPSTQSLTT